MSVFNLTCPECKTTLKTAKPIPAGTVLDCPKCGVMFPAPKPKAKDDVVAAVEVVDDDEVVEDFEVIDDDGFEVVDDEPQKSDKPRQARGAEGGEARPRQKFRPKRKKSSNQGLIIGVSVAVGVVVLLGGAGFLAYKLLFTGDREPLAFMPANTPIVGGVNMGALSQQVPKLGQLIDAGANSPQASFQNKLGIGPKEAFDQLTIGFDPQSSAFLLVGKSSVAFNRQKAYDQSTGPNERVDSVQGKKIIRVTDQNMSVYLPSDRLIVMTSLPDDRLNTILANDGRRNELNTDMQELTKRASSHHVWAVINLDGAMRQQAAGMMAMAAATDPAGAKAMQPVFDSAKALGFWGSINSGKVEFNLGVLCADKAAAETAKTALETSMKSQPAPSGMAAAAMAMMMPASIKNFQTELTQSAQGKVDGNVAIVSMSCSQSTFEALINDAPKFASMANMMMPRGPAPGPGPGRGRGGR